MNIKKLTIAALAATTSAALPAAVPEVSGVTMAQASDRLVTITYTLADAPAVITLDVQTNVTGDVWASIGGEAVWNAMGDVWRRVETGSRTITWHPDHSWPDHKIEGNNTRAVVTAWALENTPDYMVVDLTVDNTVRYYPGVDFLPKKGFDQAGAAVTNNPDYKTTKLLMRKIMARGIEWTMGSTTRESLRNASRETTHLVALTNNYYIGVFEVTQAQWKNIATNSSAAAKFTVNGEMRPVETVCYNEIRNAANTTTADASYNWPADPNPSSFLGLLRTKTGIDFELPSEAQWEFAARAGNGTGYWNDGSAILNTYSDANLNLLGRYQRNGGQVPSGTSYVDPSASCGVTNGTAIVGSYLPNAWGLYDMHGNVWEWCLDWFQGDITTYGGKVNIDPSNSANYRSGVSASGAMRVVRGGCWSTNAGSCRSASRDQIPPNWRNSSIAGFRVLCSAGLR